jgi:hypothetical protein
MDLAAEVVSTPLPFVVDQLREAGIPLLPARDQEFAKSLMTRYRGNGYLSEKQEYWLRVLYQRALGLESKPEPKKEAVGTFTGVYALFQKAKQHLKYPKIVLALADGSPIVLKLSGKNSKVPDTVNVTDDRPFGQNKWYGRVSQEGEFSQSSKIDGNEMAAVARLMRKFSENPAEMAAKHGALHGNCCFCNKKLTDEKSTAVGYGKTCAGHFGLPWGKGEA